MPRKTKTAAAAGVALSPIPNELVDRFVTGPMTAEAVNDISLAFKRALIERAPGAELSHHLGYRPGSSKTSAIHTAPIHKRLSMPRRSRTA